MNKIILASASPRRRELIARLGIPFQVVPSRIEEFGPEGEPPESFALRLAREKARDVAADRDGLIIGVDTVVVLDGVRMGKPEGPGEAAEMLRQLSGREHLVMSGLAIVEEPSGREVSRLAVTEVLFKELSAEEIDRYVATEEPMDKAGGYGIQGIGGLFVERISGCYYNVVGLPLNLLYEELHGLGFSPEF